MSRDQTVGATIFIICLLVAICFIVSLFYPQWLISIGMQTTPAEIQFWLIALPVLIGLVAILGVGVWIGWAMIASSPPTPIKEDTPNTDEKPSTDNKDE